MPPAKALTLVARGSGLGLAGGTGDLITGCGLGWALSARPSQDKSRAGSWCVCHEHSWYRRGSTCTNCSVQRAVGSRTWHRFEQRALYNVLCCFNSCFLPIGCFAQRCDTRRRVGRRVVGRVCRQVGHWVGRRVGRQVGQCSQSLSSRQPKRNDTCNENRHNASVQAMQCPRRNAMIIGTRSSRNGHGRGRSASMMRARSRPRADAVDSHATPSHATRPMEWEMNSTSGMCLIYDSYVMQ